MSITNENHKADTLVKSPRLGPAGTHVIEVDGQGAILLPPSAVPVSAEVVAQRSHARISQPCGNLREEPALLASDAATVDETTALFAVPAGSRDGPAWPTCTCYPCLGRLLQ